MPHGAADVVAARLDREELVDRRVAAEMHRAAGGSVLAQAGVADRLARRDGRLIAVGGDGDVRVDPVTVVQELVELARRIVLELGRTQLRRQSVLAPLGALLEQAL